MDNFWRPLSTNIDQEGLEFLSTMEANDYPIFATQFHPEKNAYEWAPKFTELPHTKEAVNVAQYMAEFFVDVARQSTHKFESRFLQKCLKANSPTKLFFVLGQKKRNT